MADSFDFFSIKNSMHELLKLNSSWTSPSFTVSPMFIHSITPVRNRENLVEFHGYICHILKPKFILSILIYVLSLLSTRKIRKFVFFPNKRIQE